LLWRWHNKKKIPVCITMYTLCIAFIRVCKNLSFYLIPFLICITTTVVSYYELWRHFVMFVWDAVGCYTFKAFVTLRCIFVIHQAQLYKCNDYCICLKLRNPSNNRLRKRRVMYEFFHKYVYITGYHLVYWQTLLLLCCNTVILMTLWFHFFLWSPVFVC